jgi:hypothetical protein
MVARNILGLAVLTMGLLASSMIGKDVTASTDLPHDASAAYVRVCKTARGSKDRRACRHTSRQDPQRVTVAFADPF